VTVEAEPKLCIAARAQYHRVLPYPDEFIRKTIEARIQAMSQAADVYGDKNPNYVFFIEELYRIFNCKFIFVHRDGRDVVRSTMNFDRLREAHYVRYEDDRTSSITQPDDTLWDYARLRPLPGNDSYEHWRTFSKFEKFSWLWANFNALLLKKSNSIPQENFRFVNISAVSRQTIADLFTFLHLKGFDKERVEHLLTAKINTIVTTHDEAFPCWEKWALRDKEKFEKHAHDMMMYLGYYTREELYGCVT
jgi:hypothetical protein